MVMFARLPETFAEVRRWAIGSTQDLSTLRAALHRALSDDPAELTEDRGMGQVPEKAVLVASELATNALRHGTPPTLVLLLRDGGSFAIDVVDHAVDRVPVLAGDRQPGAGGFGLVLAERVSRQVGWYIEAETTKHVWAVFDGPVGGVDAAHPGRRAHA